MREDFVGKLIYLRLGDPNWGHRHAFDNSQESKTFESAHLRIGIEAIW